MYEYIYPSVPPPAVPAHQTATMPKGGCPSWLPGTRGWTPQTCLCWGRQLTPGTTASQLEASSMASATQVRRRVWLHRRSASKSEVASLTRGEKHIQVCIKRVPLLVALLGVLQPERYTVCSNNVTMATSGTPLNCWQPSWCLGLWSGSTRPLGSTRWSGCLEMSSCFAGKYACYFCQLEEEKKQNRTC